jgi:PadR family transcriptional regulator
MSNADAVAGHSTVEEHSSLFRDLLLGFVKIHVLHHASSGAIYGAGIAAELEGHGYRLSPGTLYPLLHNLEAAKLFSREERIVDGKVRKYYHLTPLGRQTLAESRERLADLVDEVLDGRRPPRP